MKRWALLDGHILACVPPPRTGAAVGRVRETLVVQHSLHGPCCLAGSSKGGCRADEATHANAMACLQVFQYPIRWDFYHARVIGEKVKVRDVLCWPTMLAPQVAAQDAVLVAHEPLLSLHSCCSADNASAFLHTCRAGWLSRWRGCLGCLSPRWWITWSSSWPAGTAMAGCDGMHGPLLHGSCSLTVPASLCAGCSTWPAK